MFYRSKILNLEEFRKKLTENGIDIKIYPDHMQFVFPDASKFEISVSEKSPELKFSENNELKD